MSNITDSRQNKKLQASNPFKFEEGEQKKKNKKKSKKKKEVKEFRFQGKFVFLTIENVSHSKKEYWMNLAQKFRENVQAVICSVEENFKEGKGIHVHILMQFTTRQQISKKQFEEHFNKGNVDPKFNLNLIPKMGKKAIINAICYTAKTGNYLEFGGFEWRGVEFKGNKEEYRFCLLVHSVEDAIIYFQKNIRENYSKSAPYMAKIMETDTMMQRYLLKNKGVFNNLLKIEKEWRELHHSKDNAIMGLDFWKKPEELKEKYKEYLAKFPELHKKHNPMLQLEKNYNKHLDNDLSVLVLLLQGLDNAFNFKGNRPIKAHNIHLWSFKSSVGKSRLLNYLRENTPIFTLPDNQFYNEYTNKKYTCCVSDEATEFLKTKTYAHLKKIYDGNEGELNLKGKPAIKKTDNPLIFSCDNTSFDSIMNKNHGQNGYKKLIFETRVLDLEIKSRATLHFLIDEILTIQEKEEKEEEEIKTPEELKKENKQLREEIKLLQKQLNVLKYEE